MSYESPLKFLPRINHERQLSASIFSISKTIIRKDFNSAISPTKKNLICNLMSYTKRTPCKILETGINQVDYQLKNPQNPDLVFYNYQRTSLLDLFTKKKNCVTPLPIKQKFVLRGKQLIRRVHSQDEASLLNHCKKTASDAKNERYLSSRACNQSQKNFSTKAIKEKKITSKVSLKTSESTTRVESKKNTFLIIDKNPSEKKKKTAPVNDCSFILNGWDN